MPIFDALFYDPPSTIVVGQLAVNQLQFSAADCGGLSIREDPLQQHCGIYGIFTFSLIYVGLLVTTKVSLWMLSRRTGRFVSLSLIHI